MNRTTLALFGTVLLSVTPPAWSAAAPAPVSGLCDIEAFGARRGDTPQTRAIQSAIDTCAAAGGGQVRVPAGTWTTGTLILKSRIDLHLAMGAVLRGSPSMSDYPALDRRVDDHNKSIAQSGLTDPERLAINEANGQRALIYARDVEDVAISGFGTIDGQGPAFWGEGFIGSGQGRPTLPRPRPWIWFRDAKHVSVRDVTLIDSPSYFLSFETSDDVDVQGVRMRAHPLSPNSDGIQIEGGRDYRIRGVSIRTGDDAIVLKSSNAPIEQVTISDSYLESDDSAFKFGTGSTHPIRHVRMRNVQIANTRIGIALFMKDGGVFEHLDVDGLSIVTGSRHRTDYPVYVDLDRRFPDSKLGAIRHVRIANARIETRGNLLIGGHPDAPIESLRLENLDVTIAAPVDVTALPGKPRGNMMLAGQTPGADFATVNAHLVAGHVHGFVLDGFRLHGDAQALGTRAAVALRQVDRAALHDVALSGASPARVWLDDDGRGEAEVRNLDVGRGWTSSED
jgi:hypothetical protein